jgi:hypothetical protein
VKIKNLFIIIAINAILSTTAIAATSVTRHGITWSFSEDATTGTFINGDPWVVAPVTITAITPSYSSGNNGWEVNPPVGAFEQGFDDDCKNNQWNATRIPSLPYIASSGDSIVKTISSGSAQSAIQTAAVLTVLGSAPSSPSTTFRPPYFGTSKPTYTTVDLQMDLWPQYDDPDNGNTPSLANVESWFEYLRLDINENHVVRDLRPIDATGVNDGYRPDIIIRIFEGMYRLMFSDGPGTQAFYNFMQYCLDRAYASYQGYNITTADGHNPGHYPIAIMGATMFNITAIKSELKNNICASYGECFHEAMFLSWNHDESYALWGSHNPVDFSESKYWNYFENGSGSRSIKDPYNYIDGGICNPSEGYQDIVWTSYKATALLTYLMPAIGTNYNENYKLIMQNYADRYYSVGYHCANYVSDDPCAGKPAGTYGVDYGPTGGGDCIEGSPERSTYTGYADSSPSPSYYSDFINDMWVAYSDSPWGGVPSASGITFSGVTIGQ